MLSMWAEDCVKCTSKCQYRNRLYRNREMAALCSNKESPTEMLPEY